MFNLKQLTMLDFALYSNEFTPDDPDDQLARPVNVVTRDQEDLMTRVTRKGSILKPTEVRAVIDAYWEGITEFVRAGEVYSDQFISTRFDISGVFKNPDDRFDPSRHTLAVAVKVKEAVTSAVADVTLRKVDARTTQPEIKSVYDWGSDTHNATLTSEATLEVQGEQLKICDNLEEEGVFFVNQANDSEVKAERVRTNEPKTLTLMVPKLRAGRYRLEVRNTRYDGKILRIGVFTPVLTVK